LNLTIGIEMMQILSVLLIPSPLCKYGKLLKKIEELFSRFISIFV
jgi:hypothetical protein